MLASTRWPRLYDDTSRVRSALTSIGRAEPTNTAVDIDPDSIATSIAHPLPVPVASDTPKVGSGGGARHREWPPVLLLSDP